jgi:hypothetical protein
MKYCQCFNHHMKSGYPIPAILGAIIVGAVLTQSVQGAINNKPAINTIAGIAGPTFALKDNATSPAGNNTHNSTAASNNVTAASGNNGHIYRGGAAAGSGGE